METKSARLKISHVTKRFDKIEAVKQVSIEVKPGEIYALIGPNGAGKTTLIKMVTGLLAPDAGTIEVNGINIATHPVEAKRQFGYIPDEPFIYPYLSGQAFLELTGDLLGLERKVTLQQIKRFTSMYRIEEILGETFADYSRGNKQKICITAALLHSPSLLLIDEPIVGLDAESQQLTKKLLGEFKQGGGAILVCTHSLSIAQELASKIGVIDKGILQTEGTMETLQKQTNLPRGNLEEIYLSITTAT